MRASGARSGAFPRPHRGRFTLRDAHDEAERGAESAAFRNHDELLAGAAAKVGDVTAAAMRASGARSGAFPRPHRGRFTLRDAHDEAERGAESAAFRNHDELLAAVPRPRSGM
jgi:hypothetical protein